MPSSEKDNSHNANYQRLESTEPTVLGQLYPTTSSYTVEPTPLTT